MSTAITTLLDRIDTQRARVGVIGLGYVGLPLERVAAALRSGQLVILESTTYPGTTDEVALPMLEARGLTADREFFLAFSPERVDPGNQTYTTRNIPKIVGGYGPSSTM